MYNPVDMSAYPQVYTKPYNIEFREKENKRQIEWAVREGDGIHTWCEINVRL